MRTAWRPSRVVAQSQRPAVLWRWLLDPASLTERLQAVCGEFRVELLQSAWLRPAPDERRALGLRADQRALVREVFLLCDGRPWVFARSVIPRATLSGKYHRLTHLGSRSLGAVLFSDPTLRRGEVHVAQLATAHALYARATQRLTRKPPCLWGRRSLFFLRDRPLLLSEIFLHDMNSS